jgi:hypothetical protein
MGRGVVFQVVDVKEWLELKPAAAGIRLAEHTGDHVFCKAGALQFFGAPPMWVT